MKIVEYKCDLCKEKVEKEHLMSWYFKFDIIPQRYTIQSDVSLSDKHICKFCLEIIAKDFLTK